MASRAKSKPVDKARQRQERKEFREGIKVLRKNGLVPKTVDLRKVKPTKHYQGLLRKFSGVVDGTHIVAPATSKSKNYSRTRKGQTGTSVSGNKVIIPKGNRTNKVKDFRGWPARIYKHKNGDKLVEIPLPKPWDDLLDNPLVMDMETWSDYGYFQFIVKYERNGEIKYYQGLDVGELLDAKLLNSGTVRILDIFARTVIKKGSGRKP